jgi:ADYC domain
VKAMYRLAGAVACIASGTTHAAGDHTQGTYVCGAGLEKLDGGGRPTGNCLAIASGTAPSGPFTLNDATSSTITLNTPCVDMGGYWSCSAASFGSPSGNPFCGVPLGNPLPLFLIKANLSNGSFTFTSGALTAVCGGGSTAPPPPPPMCSIAAERYSTVDDCIRWGYGPTTNVIDQRRFNACVRMARADYLGNGKSATRRGIHIQPYTGIGPDLPECSANAACCGGCFEALWDENGASCIDHQRVEDVLMRLVSFAGYTRQEAEKLLKERYGERSKKKGRKGKPVPSTAMLATLAVASAPSYLCQPGTGPESALLRNRSRLHQCTSSTGPVTIKDCHTTHPDPCPQVPGPCPPP